MVKIRTKIKTLDHIIKIADFAKKSGKKIVTTNGCFDLLHPGHIANLEWAKSKGDILIVGINSDAGVRKHKDSGRPIISASNRARLLAGLSAVDYVFIFNTKTPAPWLAKVKPHIHIKGKGSEKHPDFPADRAVIEKNGGKIILAPINKKLSTTKIINKILKTYT